MDGGAGLAAQLCSHLHQLAHTLLVQVGERIGLVDLLVVVIAEELTGVIAAEAEGHLREVVGTEGEELCLGGDLVGQQGGAGDLDHGADLILEIHAGFLDDLVGGLHHDVLDKLELLDLAHQGNHDLGLNDVLAPLGDGNGRIDYGSGLHPGDLGVGDGQPAAAVPHHGVELMERGDDVLQLLHRNPQVGGDLLDVLLLGGQELMERGIQIADDHRTALHGLVKALEVALLIGHDLR